MRMRSSDSPVALCALYSLQPGATDSVHFVAQGTALPYLHRTLAPPWRGCPRLLTHAAVVSRLTDGLAFVAVLCRPTGTSRPNLRYTDRCSMQRTPDRHSTGAVVHGAQVRSSVVGGFQPRSPRG